MGHALHVQAEDRLTLEALLASSNPSFSIAHPVRSEDLSRPGTLTFPTRDTPHTANDTAGRSDSRGNSRSSLPRPAAPNVVSHSGS